MEVAMIEYGVVSGGVSGGGYSGYSGSGALDRLEALGGDPTTLALIAGAILLLILFFRRT